MSLLYRCDNCGGIVNPPDAIGKGVGENGKQYIFKDGETSGLSVTILIGYFDENSEEQFCLACMWDTLRLMMTRMAPDDRRGDTGGKDKGVPELRAKAGVPVPNSPIDPPTPGYYIEESDPRLGPHPADDLYPDFVRHPRGVPRQG